MVKFRLTIVVPLIIGVLQVCTANPITSEAEDDPTKVFSAVDLQRAKNVGINPQRLVEGRRFGLTFEEMLKFQELRNNYKPSSLYYSAEHMNKGCEILVPEQKMSKNLTSAQEAQLRPMVSVMNHLTDDQRDHVEFARSSICSYLSRPDVFEMEANSFGLPLIRYMKIRFFKSKAQKTSGSERVIVAKKMCCMHKNRGEDEVVLFNQSTFTGLPDGESTEFDEQWNAFETANTLKSFENVCDFLQSKENTNDVCVVATPIPMDEKVNE